MENLLLREKEPLPSPEVLQQIMADRYAIFQQLQQQLTSPQYALTFDWNYYKDGKAWLCKVCHKKKTVFWLSVWDTCFKTGFYFTEKHMQSIAELPIDESIKDEFAAAKPIGKLIPLAIRMTEANQIADLLTVVAFKISLK